MGSDNACGVVMGREGQGAKGWEEMRRGEEKGGRRGGEERGRGM